MRAGLLALLAIVCFVCAQASAEAAAGPPALKNVALPAGYSTSGGSSEIALTAAETKCTGETGSGEFTSAKEGTLTLKLTGCALGGKQCSTAAEEGTIESKRLKTLLAYTYPASTGSEGRETGLVLSPASGEVFAEYTCAFLNQHIAIKGALIAKVTPLDKLTNTVTLTIAKTAEGHQALTEYETEKGEVIQAGLQGSVNEGPFKSFAMEGPSTTATLSAGKEAVIAARAYGKPAVKTSPSFGEYGTSRQVKGTVDPEGLETTYHFEYGTTMSYGSSTAEASAGEGVLSQEAPGKLTGVTEGVAYHYRIVATNSAGTSYGEDMISTGEPLAKPRLQILAGEIPFTTTSGASKLNLTGAETKCTGMAGNGDMVTYKEAWLTLTLTGCTLGGKQCGNGASGEIALQPLRATLEYTYPAKSGAEGRESGFVLSPLGGEALAEYTCSFLSQKIVLKGTLMARVTPLNVRTLTWTFALTAKEGQQGISEYENASGVVKPLALEGRINSGSFKKLTAETSGWSASLNDSFNRFEEPKIEA